MLTRLRSSVSWLPAVAAGGFLGVFFVWPVLGVLRLGLGESLLGPFADVFGSGWGRSVLWFTFWQAALSTALTVALALPAAGAVARLNFRGRRLVRALVTVPFVLPTVVVAAAFEGVFDRFSIPLSQSVWAILVAHVFFNYAVVLRVVSAHWAGLDARVEDQARVLGASRAKVFTAVTLPRLAPAVAAASAIVFLFCFTSFGVVLVLGGPARATVETEIYRYAIVRLDLATAAGLAVVQLLAVAALVVVSNRLERRRGLAEAGTGFAAPRGSGAGLVANLAVMAVVLGLPVAVLVERSLTVGPAGATSYSLANFEALTQRVTLLPASAIEALVNSVAFAVPATVIALAVGAAASFHVLRSDAGRRRPNPSTGVAAAGAGLHGDERESQRSGDGATLRGSPNTAAPDGGGRILAGAARKLSGRVVDVGLTMPLGTSAVTIGLGFLVVFDQAPLDIRTSLVVVPIAHAVIGVPFVVRTLVPMLRTVSPRQREAAAVLGASPRRVRREVDLPVAARALAVGAGFAFAVSLGEFGATSFIPRRADTLTAPVALFRLLGTPGTALRGQAMALAVVLMVLTAATVLVMDTLGDRGRAGTSTGMI